MKVGGGGKKKEAWFWSSLIKLIICGPASKETEPIFFP
jgi:hypothetical protein